MNRSLRLAGTAAGALILLLAIVLILGLSGGRAVAKQPADESIAAPSCRAGVSAHGEQQAFWVDGVGAGWYVFFGGYTEVAGSDVQIAPIISVKQDKAGAQYLDSYTITPPLEALSHVIAAYPGTLWIVGNEVDRGPDPGETTTGQGDTFPDVYARAYNEVYHFIKQLDPTALVANSALVQVTPGRLQYLDSMWRSYREQFGEPMPVDIWNMHVYVLPEAELDGTPNGIANVALGTNPALAKRGPGAQASQCAQDDIYCFAEHDDMDIFEEQVRAMRRWMFDHDQREKPLILTEFSILYPCEDKVGDECGFLRDEIGNDFDPVRVQTYLTNTVTFLESATDGLIGNPLDGGRLVQQWAWFSISTTTYVGNVSDLVDKNAQGVLTGLNVLGEQYRATALNLPSYVNLVPAPIDPIAAHTSLPAGTVDVVLQASVGNNGSIPITEAFTTTFYADADLTQVIGHARVPASNGSSPLLRGCAAVTLPVSVTWPGLTAGVYPYWVVVDSQKDITEGGPPNPGGELDNVTQSLVLVDQERAWLPIVRR